MQSDQLITSQVVSIVTGSASTGYVDVGVPNTIQGSIIKFGKGALYMNGGSNCPTVSNVNVSSINNWTIEFWLYPTTGINNKTTVNRYILTSTAASKSNYGALALYISNTNQLNLTLVIVLVGILQLFDHQFSSMLYR